MSAPSDGAGPSRARLLARRLRRRLGFASPPGGHVGRPTPQAAVEDREWAKFRGTSSPELVRIPPIEVVPSLADAPRLTVLMPHLQLERMTGGPNTVLNLAGRLAGGGVPVRLASVIGPTDHDEDALRAHAARLSETRLSPDQVELMAAGAGDGPLRLGPRDVLMATWWPTAHSARVALDRIAAQEFVYLVQDFEPAFYGWSTNHALALGTYDFPIRAVVNESLLLDYLITQGVGTFAGPDSHTLAVAFEPAVDRALFHPEPRLETAPLRLLFYARPRNPRNCFELGLRALRDAVALGAFRGQPWEFLAIGSPTPPLDLGEGMTLEPTPWKSYADYAALLRSSDLLLSLMLSPHTSYPPLEMAACGGTVVTNAFGPKTASRLTQVSPALRAVAPEAGALAQALVEAASEREAGMRGDGRVAVPGTWADAFHEVIPWLTRVVHEIGGWA